MTHIVYCLILYMKNCAKTKLYIYRLTNDTGMAPCVDDGLFSLAVCKGGQIRQGTPINTGLRHLVGSNWDRANENVYVLGTYQDRFLYLARVSDVVTMEEYFKGLFRN